MGINTNTGIGSGADYMMVSNMPQKDVVSNEKKDEKAVEDKAAVYEKGSEKQEETQTKGSYKINKMTAEERAELVKNLKKEQENREQQFLDLVKKMLSKQASSFAIGTDLVNDKLQGDGIWKFLASGDYTVDEETKLQAQKDIAEDGYYGVKQTSERMFDFACALAGDDEEQMKKMQAAIEKGYEEATKAWGKELPELCKQTLDATNKLFEEYYASKQVEA